jgi:hypothetical protein
MAHREQTKAQALAMLMTGDTPGYVAAQLGVPLTTVKRWRKETRALLRDALGSEARAEIAGVVKLFPGLAKKP